MMVIRRNRTGSTGCSATVAAEDNDNNKPAARPKKSKKKKAITKNNATTKKRKTMQPTVTPSAKLEKSRRPISTGGEDDAVLVSDLEEIWSRADGERKREVPKVDMALVSIDDS